MSPERQYPLTWPAGWKRTKNPGPSQFKTEPGRATTGLTNELLRLGASKVIISSNAQYRNDGMPYARQAAMHDCGVAVYFNRKGKDMVFACDTYWNLHENIHAIAKTIEALRAIERWGASDMLEKAFTGFLALPAPIAMGGPVKRPWREVLELGEDYTVSVIQLDAAYRRLASLYHPDKPGGSAEKMTELNTARDEAYKEIT